MWYCYLLYSESINRTYIGITNNIDKRIQQHNQLIFGGAKATKMAKDWQYKKTIKMPDKSTALSFEYKWKQANGLDARIKKSYELIKEFKLSYEN